MKTLKQLLDAKTIKKVISVSPEATVYDALEVLAEYKIGALAIMDHDKLVGIFSERDYAREIALKGRSSKTTIIRDVMTSKLITAKPDDLVDMAMQMISEKRIRHIPVMDGNTLLGILSIGDLVKETIEYQADLIKQLERYITG